MGVFVNSVDILWECSLIHPVNSVYLFVGVFVNSVDILLWDFSLIHPVNSVEIFFRIKESSLIQWTYFWEYSLIRRAHIQRVSWQVAISWTVAPGTALINKSWWRKMGDQ